MSIQAVASVLDTDVGEVSAKMLLVCIANAHNTTTGICCPSIDRLAAESGMSRSSVKRWLRWLAEHQFIEVIERRDTTGRQQAHDYRLTLGEGFKLTPSEQDVEEGSNLDHRESNAEPGEGVTVEPPLKKPEELPSPQPPLAGGLSFASLWEVWPEEHRGVRENAEGAFGKLAFEDKAVALAAAPLAVKAMTRRKTRFPALVRFIRERTFEDFHNGPEIDNDGDFIIKPGRPEWGPWLGWLRLKHGQRAVDDTVKRGYFLPGRRWPEGHENAKAAA